MFKGNIKFFFFFSAVVELEFRSSRSSPLTPPGSVQSLTLESKAAPCSSREPQSTVQAVKAHKCLTLGVVSRN